MASAKAPVFVLSAHLGDHGGSALAPLLLAKELTRLGERVVLFVTSPVQNHVRKRLEAAGVEVVTPWYGRGSRLHVPQRLLICRLFLQARRQSPSFILTVSLAFEAKLLLRLPALPPIYLWETTEALPHVKFVEQKIGERLRRASAVLAPSETIASNIRKTYAYDGPLYILPFWVEPARAEEIEIPHVRTQNILYVGRLDLDKGFEHLFASFRDIRSDYPHATLTIRGSGPLAPLREMARDIPGIDIDGYISPLEYGQAIRRCDAVILPSFHEGYPLSLLDSCARGRPVVATSVGSIPEVFGECPCALLVSPRSAMAITAAIRTIFSESELRYKERCDAAYGLFHRINSPDVVQGRLSAIRESIGRSNLGRSS